mmetsp:Transcript_92964/g.263105  ORF Transcript_92964/g.263105 Transcript_92964/m.263105 type:complete len:248 (+) Transcript_92964:1466-2209(+)
MGHALDAPPGDVQPPLRHGPGQGGLPVLPHPHRPRRSELRARRADDLLGPEGRYGARVPGQDLDGELRRGHAPLRARRRVGPDVADRDPLLLGRGGELHVPLDGLPASRRGGAARGRDGVAQGGRGHPPDARVEAVRVHVHHLRRLPDLRRSADASLRPARGGRRMLERLPVRQPLQVHHGRQDDPEAAGLRQHELVDVAGALPRPEAASSRMDLLAGRGPPYSRPVSSSLQCPRGLQRGASTHRRS